MPNYAKLSFETTLEIFERFNWQMSDKSRAILKNDQEKFLLDSD